MASEDERQQSIVLVRTAVNAPKKDDLDYLLETFGQMQVSIYCLPSPNLFDFALVGPVPAQLAETKIANSHHVDGTGRPVSKRFDFVMHFSGTRLVYRGQPLRFDVPDQQTVAEYVCIEKKDDAVFQGMLFFHYSGLMDDPEKKRDFIEQLTGVLRRTGAIDGRYCLSFLRKNEDLGLPDHRCGGRAEFSSAPFRDCNAWVRVGREVAAGELPSLSLDWLHRFHHEFRRSVDKSITTICFPISPQRITTEIASPADTCKALIATQYLRDTFHAFWFGFDRSNSGGRAAPPDLKMPIGNFVISAEARLGKTNAAMALIDAYCQWDGELQNSPGYSRFDVVYVNFKADGGAAAGRTSVSEINEARLLKAFLARRGQPADCVRPEHLMEYMCSKRTDERCVVYTESSGATKWLETVQLLVDKSPRPGCGLVLVIDEAFRELPAGSERQQDFYGLLHYVFNTVPSKGVRMVLIGQEVVHCKSKHPDVYDLVFGKSTVVVARQGDSECVREVLTGLDKEVNAAEYARVQKIIDWLGCGSLAVMNAIADKAAKPFKVGPVIARPSLFGEKTHAVPCHIEPAEISADELMAIDCEWWVPHAHSK